MKSKIFIYGLQDPRSYEIRYVGQTAKGNKRFKGHVGARNNNREKHTNKALWLRELDAVGLAPIFVVLEYVDKIENLTRAERFWIDIAKTALGTRLFNKQNGGNAITGYKQSEQTKKKMSEIKLKAWRDPEFRAKTIAAQNRGKNTPEFKEKRSRISIEMYANNEELKAKLRAATLLQLSDPVKREHLFASKQAAQNTPEYIAKLSARQKIVLNRPEAKAKKRATMEALGLWLPR